MRNEFSGSPFKTFPNNNGDPKKKLITHTLRSLRGILKNSILQRNKENMNQALLDQISILNEILVDFMNQYHFDSNESNLNLQIRKYIKKLNKTENLLKQSNMFDQESKISYLEGLAGMIDKSALEVLDPLQKTLENLRNQSIGVQKLDLQDIDIEFNEVEQFRIFDQNGSPVKQLRFSKAKQSSGSKYVSPIKVSKDSQLSRHSNIFPIGQKSPIAHGRDSRNEKKSSSFRIIDKQDFINQSFSPQLNHHMSPNNSVKTRLKYPPSGFGNSTPMKGTISTHISSVQSKKQLIKLSVEQGEGSVTVVKLIDESSCAVGFTSGDLIFYDLKNYRSLYGHKEHKSAISSIEVAVIGLKTHLGMQSKKILLTGGSEHECSILVWNIETMKPLKRLSGHEHLISSIVDLGDSASIATSSFDSKIAIWDLSENFSCVQLLDEIYSPILCLDFNSTDNIMAAGALDGTVSVWQVFYQNEIYHGCSLKTKLKLSGHVIEISRSLQLDDVLITLESDFVVRAYKMSTGRLLKIFKGASPFVDFLIVELSNSTPVLYCLDNSNEVHKFDDWSFDKSKVLICQDHAIQEKELSIQDDLAKIKQFIGYSPKSEILIQGKSLFMLSSDQYRKNLVLQELKI